MKRIAFAKVGKSIKFASAFSPIGGDNEAPAILRALANNNPNITFYIVGRSDFHKLDEIKVHELFPYGNVVDVWGKTRFLSETEKFNHIIQQHKKYDFEYGIMMFGQVGTVTIPGKTQQVKNRDLIASVIDMTKNYTSPITMWMNECKVPYVEIQNDPRYNCNQARDIFHLPEVTLSQYDYTLHASHMKSYEDQDRITTDVKAVYAGMEMGFCYDRPYPTLTDYKKNVPFTVVLNEGSPSRYNMLKEWVLDYNEDVEIYGKWEHEDALSDVRFKGSLKLEELQPLLHRTKYTLIIPIAKGWVTSKYIEMIHNGVIPFFHPTYDEQKHIEVNDFLRPKSPKDLMDRIKFLEENPEQYNVLLEKMQRMLKHSYYDGTYMSQQILGSFIDNYELPDLSQYQKQEVKTNSLEDFFS